MDKKTIRTVIIVVLMVIVILVVYAVVSNKRAQNLQNSKVTEVDRLELYDMDNDYPEEPRDVIKLQCRYMKAIYGEDLEDGDLKKLVNKMRDLYSEELTSQSGNTADAQVKSIEKEKESHEDDGYKITNYTVEEASLTTYGSYDGKKTAGISATFTYSLSKKVYKNTYTYALVKEDDKWKIVGWQEDTSSTTTTEASK